MQHVEWSKNAVIYELNTRQFSQEGTFRAVEKQLQRLKELGVGILWIMPIYPIGIKSRKGSLGSYYSVKDYVSLNPEFGSMDDFKALVKSAHQLGLKIILDWVANHTSRDASWIAAHPDWYIWEHGEIVAPYDWSDVAQLDVANRNMWKGMASAMKFWLEEADVDGFRCDMASLLPVDFWNYIRKELDAVKPVFMLAESEDPALQQHAFDATYCWELLHILDGIAQGKKTPDDLSRYFAKNAALFRPNDMRMAFTSNHDENSWSGSEFERMGIAAKQMAAFTYVIPAIPLIYNGQEVALSNRLSFFEKDTIEWGVNLDFTQHYQLLNRMKKAHKCLWNADWGGSFSYAVDFNRKVFRVRREKDDDLVVGIFNFSRETVSIRIPEDVHVDCLTQRLYAPDIEVVLRDFQYLILTNR